MINSTPRPASDGMSTTSILTRNLWAGDGGVTRRVAGVLRQFREHTRCEIGREDFAVTLTMAHARGGDTWPFARRSKTPATGTERPSKSSLATPTPVDRDSPSVPHGGGESSGAKGADRALPSFSRWVGFRQVADGSRGETAFLKCATPGPRTKGRASRLPELPTDGKAAMLRPTWSPGTRKINLACPTKTVHGWMTRDSVTRYSPASHLAPRQQ